ncbi:MAG: hypothetical protein JXA77_06940 [Bacteroidales bacterium]|nr:hypothetical protein [Bacteroidales bacterium]MBN2819872.1 hypothetical protein [Bacteroidales bacterium]
MRKPLFFLLGALLFSFLQSHVFAQAVSETGYAKQKNLLLSAGLGYASFRDFATSPLFYNGPGISLAIEKQTLRQKSENVWGFSPLISSTLAGIPKSNYYQTSASSMLMNFDAYFQYLRFVPQLSLDKLHIKAGGTLMATQNIRINQSLNNAALGAESFVNLMLALKADKDISRNEEKNIKLWFLNIKQKPATRNLSFQANIGLLNFNHRPSYNYFYFSEIDGNSVSSLSSLMKTYAWSLNGWRVGTKIEFSKFASSGNGFKIAYVWDIASAPGKHEAFQMVSHRIQYSLIINKNK